MTPRHLSTCAAIAALVGIAMSFGAAVARADVVVEAQTMALSAEDVFNLPPADKQTDPMSAFSTQTSAAGTATAMATINGSESSVEARITGDAIPDAGTIAAASITEQFTYLTDGSATYTLEVSGTVAGGDVALLTLILAAGQDLAPFDLETLDLTFLEGEGFGWEAELVSGTYSITTPAFNHLAGQPTNITFLIALVGVGVFGSYDADFIGTVELTESSKTDFTTGSGNPLNSTLVIQVPTPATALILFIAGLLGLVPARQRAALRRR